MADQDGDSVAPEEQKAQTEFPQVFGVPPQESAGMEEPGSLHVPPEEPLPGRAPAPSEAPPVTSPKPEAAPSRLLCLDAFRGLTIFGMILVNNMMLDEATPDQLIHAPWNGGVRVADLVFPWFLLSAGVSIPFAAASHRRKGRSAGRYSWKALKRTLTLLLLGCLLDSSIAHQPVIGLGVLQIIGLAYLGGALLYWLPPGGRLSAAALLLAGYWATIRFVAVPGHQAGLFLEGENIIRHINSTYLQRYHLSGLPSVVPTSALVLIGTGIGDAFRAKGVGPAARVALLALGGPALAIAGWLWNLDIPFNKPVWTPPYILFAAGLGALVLGVFYLVTDVLHWRAWAFPLAVFGSNAVLAYMLPILVKVYVLQGWIWPLPDGSTVPLQQAILGSLTAHAGRVPGGWLYTFGYLAVWWLVLLHLNRRGVFIRA